MPAGDLVDAVSRGWEWDALLIDTLNLPAELPDYWLTRKSSVEGFAIEHEYEDLRTAAGVAPGTGVPMAMYPTLLGVAVKDADAYDALVTAMAPTMTRAPLAWWDRHSGEVLIGDALPRRCAIVTEQGTQDLPYVLVDLQWVIPDVSEIEVYTPPPPP